MMIKQGVLAVLVLVSSLAWAGEEKKVEGPDSVTSKNLAKTCSDWVEADMKVKGGRFLFYDAVTKKTLVLTPKKLDDGAHIHRLSETRVLSWGVFEDAAGAEVLLDFFFVFRDGNLLFDNEVSIYSIGKEKRYAWDEAEGAKYISKIAADKADENK